MKRNVYYIPIYEIEKIISNDKISGINVVHEIDDNEVATLTILPEEANGFCDPNSSFKMEAIKNENGI